MKDGFERQKFVRSCVEQMRSASDELDRVSEEYNTVTAYLKDIEEIDSTVKENINFVFADNITRSIARKRAD